MASRKAASSVFADAGDDKVSLMTVKTAPAPRDVRKVKYSAELAVVGFTPQSRDEKHPSEDQQLELNKLWSVSGWSNLNLPLLKRT